MSDYKFETLQLHVGQRIRIRQATPVQFLFMRLPHMYSGIPPTRLPVLVLPMPEIFTAD